MYKHENINSRLSIKRLNKNVATVNLIDYPKEFNVIGKLVYQVRIVLFENLKQIK